MKMKTKSSLIIGIFTLAMIFGTFTMIIGLVRADSPTFTVSPTGVDDTANIQAAFDDAIAAGPGSIVQLTLGQFYTNAILAENFYGTFMGAGMDLTKIDVPRGLDPEAPGVLGPYGPSLFTFAGGEVCISDLSFDITPEKPAELWYDPDPAYDLVSLILITGDINSRIESIKCTGHEGTFPPFPYIKSFNIRLGIECNYGTGRHIITKCNFDSLWGGISAYVLMNAEMKIKSNSFKGGTFGIVNMDNSYSKFEISRNDIQTEFLNGIWVWQIGDLTPSLSPSQWLITHNNLKVSNSADGIGLWDHTPIKSLEAVVSHNKIILEDTIYGGIWTEGLQDAFISNNIIRGTGDYGIGCFFAYNNLILGNNVQNVDASWVHIALLRSSECVIVGGSTKMNVLDFKGTNNLIVGMNNMLGNPPGPEIQEAMEQKREFLQSFLKF